MQQYYSLVPIVCLLLFFPLITNGQEKPDNRQPLDNLRIGVETKYLEEIKDCPCSLIPRWRPTLSPKELKEKDATFGIWENKTNTETKEYIELKKLNELLEQKILSLEKEIAELRKHK